MDFYTIIGIIGMCLILIGFLLNQTGTLNQEMLSYDLINLIGSILLVAYAINGNAWPFVILNAVWALYSLKDVTKAMVRKLP